MLGGGLELMTEWLVLLSLVPCDFTLLSFKALGLSVVDFDKVRGASGFR